MSCLFSIHTVDSFEIWNCNRCGGKKERKEGKIMEEKKHDRQKTTKVIFCKMMTFNNKQIINTGKDIISVFQALYI